MNKNIPGEFAIALDLVSRRQLDVNAAALVNLRTAAEAGTLTILRNPLDEPIGYISWARVNADSVHMASEFGKFPMMLWEFQEGYISLIFSVFFLHPFDQHAKKELQAFIRARRAIFYVRKNRKCMFIRTATGFRLSKR